MKETTLDCPSCNRRIRIALRSRVDFSLTSEFDDLTECPITEHYDIRDVLYVNQELAHENERLRGIIRHMEIVRG